MRTAALTGPEDHAGGIRSPHGIAVLTLRALVPAAPADPVTQGLAADLTGPTGPIEPVLERLDPLGVTPRALPQSQLDDVIAFVRDGLLDRCATPDRLRNLVPERVPSGSPVLMFEFRCSRAGLKYSR